MKITKKEILHPQLNLIKPSKEDSEKLKKQTLEIIKLIESNIRKSKLNASVFIGGSSAKGTLIKKEKYDVDLFVRFDKKYDDKKISESLAKIIPKDAVRVHGSRDYFKINKENITFEIIPVIKINKPSEAKNITDLSYFHVNYVKNKINKNKKLADEIMLSKAFIHFSDCYGAESYINGFSGYAVELLIIKYGSFIKFIEAIAKHNNKEQKIILDPAKFYKNKDAIMQELNEAKINSPIILIDPTFKERNALAALSLETFLKFQQVCKKFLANPSNNFFKSSNKEEDFDKKHKNAIKIILSTNRQAGDIAGTKLKKFSRFFLKESSRYFDIEASEFVYDEMENKGRFLLVVKQKSKIIFPGPPITMKKPLAEFKKEHKNIKIIKGQAFAYGKSIDFNQFMKDFLNKKSSVIDSMGIERVEY